MDFGARHDGINHHHETGVCRILQANHIQHGIGGGACVLDGETSRRHQAVGLQFFAAQAHHHHFTAEIRVEADVAQGANRNVGAFGINGHTAPVGVLQPHHIVHIGIVSQQLLLDALHRKVHHPGNTLHGGGDG